MRFVDCNKKITKAEAGIIDEVSPASFLHVTID